MKKGITIGLFALAMLLVSSCSKCRKEGLDEEYPGTETREARGRREAKESSSRRAVSISNDNDPNVKCYTYSTDKSSKYEDGIFDDCPDYLALPASLKGVDEQILMHKSYAVSYNRRTRLANWVAWHLTSGHTHGSVERPQRAFHDDEDVDNCTHYWEYNNSRAYNRGHLCPAGDNKWDKDAMYDSFLMTNVLPQHHSLNSGVWNDIEIQCREWARNEGDIYIVSGPIFYENRKGEPKTLGKNKIPIPDAFFKVVMSNRGSGKGIGFVCENHYCGNNMNDFVVNIDDVEQITGIDFFPALPDDLEEEIESSLKFKF